MQERPSELVERMRALEERCRDAGFPLTVQRRTILETVLLRDDHPTAEQILEALPARVPGVSRATVYRTLEALVQLGVIGRAHHLGVATRFDANASHHHHLVCVRCNRVTDFSDSRLDGLPLPDCAGSGFQAADYSVHFTGLCGECRQAGQSATS